MALAKARKATLFLAAVAVIGLLAAAAVAMAGVGHVDTRITDNSFHDSEPQISGDNVVWSGNTGEIYFYNGSTTAALTANSFIEYTPQISGNNAVWAGNSGPAFTSEVYFYDGSTVTTLTANSYNDRLPQISGNKAVWQGTSGPGGSHEIYFYDGSTVTTLTANSWRDERPQISGNKAVWQGMSGPGSTYEIYYYDGSTVTTLTANAYNDEDPRISGNNVVWWGESGPGGWGEIYLYNGSTGDTTALTDGSNYAFGPRISGNNVVWEGDSPGGIADIFFYNGSTVTTLTDNLIDASDPQISGDNAVWYGGDWTTGGREIYFYNGSTVTTITANSYNDMNPQISGDTIVWHGTSGPGLSEEIYMARIDEGLPLDPAVTGSAPAKNTWTNDNTILVNFAGATDASSGVDGFSFEWSGSPTTVPDAVKDLEESAALALSPAQPDGDRWFHLRTRDNAGNWTSTIHYGPFKIDTTKPTALVRAPRSVVASGATTRFRVSWRGADAASGVKNFDVRYRIGKRGKWKAWKTGVSALKARFTAKTGKTYFFRARARDKAGNVGAWSKFKRTIVSKL